MTTEEELAEMRTVVVARRRARFSMGATAGPSLECRRHGRRDAHFALRHPTDVLPAGYGCGIGPAKPSRSPSGPLRWKAPLSFLSCRRPHHVVDHERGRRTSRRALPTDAGYSPVPGCATCSAPRTPHRGRGPVHRDPRPAGRSPSSAPPASDTRLVVTVSSSSPQLDSVPGIRSLLRAQPSNRPLRAASGSVSRARMQARRRRATSRGAGQQGLGHGGTGPALRRLGRAGKPVTLTAPPRTCWNRPPRARETSVRLAEDAEAPCTSRLCTAPRSVGSARPVADHLDVVLAGDAHGEVRLQ